MPGCGSRSAHENGEAPGRHERPVKVWQEIGHLGRPSGGDILVGRLPAVERDGPEDITLLNLVEVSAESAAGTFDRKSATWSADLADEFPHLREISFAARRCDEASVSP
jgi:hypothetical protein